MCLHIGDNSGPWDREQEVLRWEPRAIIWIWGHGGLLSPCLFPQGVAGIEEGPLFADIGRRHLGGKRGVSVALAFTSTVSALSTC